MVLVLAVVAVVLLRVVSIFVDKIAGPEYFGLVPLSVDVVTRRMGRLRWPRLIPSKLEMVGKAGNDRSVGSDGNGASHAIRKGTRHSEWL